MTENDDRNQHKKWDEDKNYQNWIRNKDTINGTIDINFSIVAFGWGRCSYIMWINREQVGVGYRADARVVFCQAFISWGQGLNIQKSYNSLQFESVLQFAFQFIENSPSCEKLVGGNRSKLTKTVQGEKWPEGMDFGQSSVSKWNGRKKLHYTNPLTVTSDNDRSRSSWRKDGNIFKIAASEKPLIKFWCVEILSGGVIHSPEPRHTWLDISYGY